MFTSPKELSLRWGAVEFVQLTDRDGDGESDDQVAVELATDANREVEGMLVKKGFSHEQLKVLARDETLRRCAADIAREIAAQQKTSFVRPDGTTIFTPAANSARKRLLDVAAAIFRLPLERAEGGGSTTAVRARRLAVEPKFFFAPNRCNPKGSGGF
jgi:hypothetical protein